MAKYRSHCRLVDEVQCRDYWSDSYVVLQKSPREGTQAVAEDWLLSRQLPKREEVLSTWRSYPSDWSDIWTCCDQVGEMVEYFTLYTDNWSRVVFRSVQDLD